MNYENNFPDDDFSLDYNFSSDEIKLIAKLFRKNQFLIPRGLENFARQIELKIYENMSIDEVERFYK